MMPMMTTSPGWYGCQKLLLIRRLRSNRACCGYWPIFPCHISWSDRRGLYLNWIFFCLLFLRARFLNPRSKVAPRIDSWLRFAVSFRGLTRVADWKRLHSRGSKLEVWPIAVCCLTKLLAASCRLLTSPTHCKAEGRGGGLALLYGCRFVTVSCFDFAIMKLLLLVRCALLERVWTNQSEKLTSKIIQIVYGNYCGASIISVLTIGQWSQGDCFGCCYCCCCCCSVVVFSPVWETTAAAAS